MKKIAALVCAFCLSASLMAQEEEVANQQPIKGIHPYKLEQNAVIAREHSNWSLIPYAGVNWFFGDFSRAEYRTNFFYPTLGLAVEYSFNPVWSLGLEYDFARYRVLGAEPDKGVNSDTMLLGNVHMPHLYMAVDFANFFYPYGHKKIFSLIGQIGAGASLHKNKVQYSADDRGKTAAGTPTSMSSYDFNPFIKFGLGLEFNLNRTIALGVRASYDLFLSDMVDGRMAGPNTDGMLDVALNMRFKLQAVSRTQARNVPGRDFPDQRLITASEAEGFIRDAAGNLVRVPAEDVKMAEAVPVYIHDTVIVYHDTIIREAAPATAAYAVASAQGQYYYIYFASNKTTLDDEGLITVQQIADRMEDDSTLYAVIEGYCDNTGNNQVNYRIGDERAQSVLTELRDEHEIPADHLYAGGIGKLVGKRNTAAYGPNRRAVVRLVDKETFDLLRGALDDKKEQREPAANTPTVTVPLSVSRAITAKNDEFKNRNSEKVRSDKNTTLSGLARKYYGNTHCWVYLYAANRDQLTTPNNIKPGTMLTIPELTQEELAITKEQCLSLYRQAQRRR